MPGAPTPTEPKFTEVGETVTITTPAPESATVCGLPMALVAADLQSGRIGLSVNPDGRTVIESVAGYVADDSGTRRNAGRVDSLNMRSLKLCLRGRKHRSEQNNPTRQ